MTAKKTTSLKYILLGGIAATTAFAFTAMADHPHKPKKAEKTKTEAIIKKMKTKKADSMKADAMMAESKMEKASAMSEGKKMSKDMMSEDKMMSKDMKSKDMKDSGAEMSDDKDEKWDVTNPPGDKREIDINVSEGTWMSLDVSPDGQTIAFDLLGDIYTMPVTHSHEYRERYGVGDAAAFLSRWFAHCLHLRPRRGR